MKKALTITLLLLTAVLAVQAQTPIKTDSIKTTLRIILSPTELEGPEGGWEYYFYADEKGHPPILLSYNENVFTVTTTKPNVNGYIYAKSVEQSRQTNNYSFNLKGKPLYIVVTGNSGVVVEAHTYKKPNRYLLVRNLLPEANRKPW